MSNRNRLSGKARKHEPGVRGVLRAAGVTERKEQDDIVKEGKKLGIRALALTPVSWVSSTFTGAYIAGSLGIAALATSAGKAALIVGGATAIGLGAAVWNKIRDGKAASKKIVEDREAGRDPDISTLDNLKQHRESLKVLDKRHTALFRFVGKSFRSLKAQIGNHDRRLTALEADQQQPQGQNLGPADVAQMIAASEQKMREEQATKDAATQEQIGQLQQEVGTLRQGNEALHTENAALRGRIVELEQGKASHAEVDQKLGAYGQAHAAQQAQHDQRVDRENAAKFGVLEGRVDKHEEELGKAHRGFQYLNARLAQSPQPLSSQDAERTRGVLGNAQELRARARRRPDPQQPAKPPQPPQPGASNKPRPPGP